MLDSAGTGSRPAQTGTSTSFVTYKYMLCIIQSYLSCLVSFWTLINIMEQLRFGSENGRTFFSNNVVVT